MTSQIKKVKKITPQLLRRHGVIRAGIFGSVAREEDTRGSDIDFVVQFRGRKSLFDLVGLKMDLEKKLQRKVDVVTYSSLHPRLKKRILKEQLSIL